MRKIKEGILTILLVFIVLGVVVFIDPSSREPVGIGFSIALRLFKDFFAEDILKEIILYVVILFLITGGSLHVSRRKENQIWSVVGLILSIISIFSIHIWLNK